jgi:hypothetical protein
MTGDGLRDEALIRVNELSGVADADAERLRLECGEKIVRVYGERNGAEDELLQWYTTEALLFDRWRGVPGLYGLDKRRELATLCRDLQNRRRFRTATAPTASQ